MPTLTAPLPAAEYSEAARDSAAIVNSAVRALIDGHVDVPLPLVKSLDNLTYVLAQLNESVTPQEARATLAHAIVTGKPATSKDYAAVTLADEIRATLMVAVTTGYELAREGVREHRDTIIATLARSLAVPAFEALTDLANRVGPQDSAATLLRSDRDADARDLANAPAHLDSIRRAVATRQALHRSGRLEADVFGPAGLWRYDPHLSHEERRKLPKDGSPLDAWLATLREGKHTPWFPTYAQARAYDVEVTDRLATEQAGLAAASHRRRNPSLLPS